MPSTGRNTIQRKLVLSVVKDNLHPTAEDVYKSIRVNYPDISLGTVYRNLSLLAERGDIQKVPVPGAADRFDRDISNHYHVYCINCGAFGDIHGLTLGAVNTEASHKTGYNIMGHSLIFAGLCPDCQK